MNENPQRIQIIIVDREQQWRFPRTKKRRIRAKWRARSENWRPQMVPICHFLLMGADAAKYAAANPVAAGVAYDGTYEFSTDLWCMVAGLYPEFAERCDLFEYELIPRDGVEWREAVPLPWRDWENCA